MLGRSFLRYQRIPSALYLFIGAELLMQVVQAAFILILNIYLRKKGYQDDLIANMTMWRYVGVFFLAIPVGLLIRNIRLKPVLLVSSILYPICSLGIVYGVEHGWDVLLYACFLGWGIGLMMMNVAALPFILRTTTLDVQTESISLSYATYSLGSILAGIIILCLPYTGQWLPDLIGRSDWDEYAILLWICLFSFFGVFLLLFMKEQNTPHYYLPTRQATLGLGSYDWGVILYSMIPVSLIATGAGITIPFINLFFNTDFGLDYADFSELGTISAVLVFVSSLIVPGIKRSFGYRVAITFTQSLAVFFLVLLALSELGAPAPWALWVAFIAYTFRQPLMNMASPMTSELLMNVVGHRNRELVSAINSCIWSGSHFLGSLMFGQMRKYDMPFIAIFLSTSVLYAIGVWHYNRMIAKLEADTQAPV